MALQAAWYSVVSIDNFCNSKKIVNDHILNITWTAPIFYEWDCRDRDFLEGIFQQHPIDAVIHFAACKSVGESCEKPFVYYENNVGGLLVLLEIMQQYSVKDIIFSSSATVYASEVLTPPFAEDDQTGMTTNPYGTTKLIAEYILRDIALHAWFRALALRYFNPVGSHTSGLLGEDPQGTPSNLLPYLLRVASGEYEKLNVYGDDYDTPDGSCIRDYIHVHDVAEGHVAALSYLLDHVELQYDTVNLGTWHWTSVLECIAAAEKVLKRSIPYEVSARRPGDVPVSVASVQKAKKLFAWEAKLSIEEAIRDAWYFLTQNRL